MHSLKSFEKAYETDRAEVVIRGRRFTLFVPKSLDAFMDPTDVFRDFPLGACSSHASAAASKPFGQATLATVLADRVWPGRWFRRPRTRVRRPRGRHARYDSP